MDAMLMAATVLTPTSSKHTAREPYMVNQLAALLCCLDHTQPFGTAVTNCFTSAFWGVAHVGELTVPNLGAFNAACHIKLSNVRHATDHMCFKITALFIHKTKFNPIGEDVYWAAQPGLISDPDTAFSQHFAINDLPAN